MVHKFNIWRDFVRPLLYKVIGHRYSCCNKFKRCERCLNKNNYHKGSIC